MSESSEIGKRIIPDDEKINRILSTIRKIRNNIKKAHSELYARNEDHKLSFDSYALAHHASFLLNDAIGFLNDAERLILSIGKFEATKRVADLREYVLELNSFVSSFLSFKQDNNRDYVSICYAVQNLRAKIASAVYEDEYIETKNVSYVQRRIMALEADIEKI